MLILIMVKITPHQIVTHLIKKLLPRHNFSFFLPLNSMWQTFSNVVDHPLSQRIIQQKEQREWRLVRRGWPKFEKVGVGNIGGEVGGGLHKIGVLGTSANYVYNENFIIYVSAHNLCLVKTLFLRYEPKCSLPVRLLYFQMIEISRLNHLK